MVRQRLGFLGMLCFLCTTLFSQSTMNTSGGTITASNMRFEYSIGETMATPSNPRAIYTVGSGVIQPSYLISATKEAFDKQFSFSVFPNPTTEGVTIETDYKGFKTIEIINMNGQTVRSTIFNYQTITLQDVPNGTYTFILRGQKGIYKSFKIIKQ